MNAFCPPQPNVHYMWLKIVEPVHLNACIRFTLHLPRMIFLKFNFFGYVCLVFWFLLFVYLLFVWRLLSNFNILILWFQLNIKMWYIFLDKKILQVQNLLCTVNKMTLDVKQSECSEKKYFQNTERCFKMFQSRYVVFMFIIQGITHNCIYCVLQHWNDQNIVVQCCTKGISLSVTLSNFFKRKQCLLSILNHIVTKKKCW